MSIKSISTNFGEVQAKKEIQCGPLGLRWTNKGTVYFCKSKEEREGCGVELAPTIWKDISEVNVFDSRLNWYKFDEGRKRVNVPIDQLWKDESVAGSR